MTLINKLAAGVLTVGAVVLVTKFVEVHRMYKKSSRILARYEADANDVQHKLLNVFMFQSDKIRMVNTLIDRYKYEYATAGFDKEGEVFFERQRELLMAMAGVRK